VIRTLVWQVIWIDAGGRGLGACGHRHATDDDAAACPFEPGDLPEVCAGLVREVRDPDYTAPEDGYAWRRRPRQFELALEASP
jgi:hypothetical protein